MFLFVVYSVIFLVLLHIVLYYLNVDYLNIIQNRKTNIKNKKSSQDIDDSILLLENSLNELKHNSTESIENNE